MRVLFLFLDGVGLGPATEANPLAQQPWPAFAALTQQQAWTNALQPVRTGELTAHPIDATLGVDGLPQSGTGQATLFTGVNCAEAVGRHFGPFPHSETHDILRNHNLFRRISNLSEPDGSPARVAFANAYPPRFFDFARGRGRWTVTTFCAMESDTRIRGVDDLHDSNALAADITARGWTPLGHDVPAIDESTAADNLVQLHRKHRLTLFEYFLTDKAGHGRLDRPATEILSSVHRFVSALTNQLNPTEDLLLITSDHGNVEDTTRKTHTRHSVPLIAYGAGAAHFRDVDSLVGVTPAIERALQAEM